MDIGILGGGSFGIALGIHLAKKGHAIKVWEIEKQRVEFIQKNNQHDLLKNVEIPKEISVSTDISHVKRCSIILVVVPSQFVIDSCNKVKEFLENNTPVICCSKGFDIKKNQASYLGMKEVLDNPIAVLSGPSHAEELAQGMLTGIVIASEDEKLNQKLKNIFISDNFVVETSNDPVGVQLAAAFKNILAILNGVICGLGWGNNAEALLLTKGFHDLFSFTTQFGGEEETVYGLAGFGDVIVTCMSAHSRNRTFGKLIGQGMSKANALSEVGMAVEGLTALSVVHKLCKEKNISLPVIDVLWAIIEENKNAKESIQSLIRKY